MTIFCQNCGSRNLRPSHLRLKDLGYFLILRYPVRCRHCRKRLSVSIFRIGEVRREAEARRGREEHEEHKSHAHDPGWRTFKDHP